MLELQQTLDFQVSQAQSKVTASRHPGKFLLSAMLAGFFIGLAVVLMLTAAGPFSVENSAATKLVSGAVFAVGLILVVFAGAELSTGSMMILTQGVFSKSTKWLDASITLIFSLFGNLLGSILCGWMVLQSGVLTSNSAAGQYLETILNGKTSISSSQLFFRAVLCNILVCLAIWGSNRAQTEIGKATVIFWCLLVFVTSGYEHVVANMTTFSLGLFSDPTLVSWAEFGRNITLVGAGNLVGGALFIGVTYWVIAGKKQ